MDRGVHPPVFSLRSVDPGIGDGDVRTRPLAYL